MGISFKSLVALSAEDFDTPLSAANRHKGSRGWGLDSNSSINIIQFLIS
jgi:hypothetical protein